MNLVIRAEWKKKKQKNKPTTNTNDNAKHLDIKLPFEINPSTTFL